MSFIGMGVAGAAGAVIGIAGAGGAKRYPAEGAGVVADWAPTVAIR